MRDARLTAALRQRVTDRANGCCEYCWSQARYATHPFSVEHTLATREERVVACV
jgi:molybdenum cofactor biosynthesis enzyme MoaA